MTKAWLKTTLGEIADIVSGATPSTSEEKYWGGDVRWVTPKDLSDLETPEISETSRSISDAGLRSCAATVLPANSVLLSSRAPIGLVAINSVPMATNQGFKSFVPDHRRVESKFLYWWLKKNRPLLESLGNGATFKEISKKTTAAIPISLPPIEEQRRIASILDATDALRTKRRQALAKLDTLTQAIFIDMFERGESFATVQLADHAIAITKGTTPTSVGFDFTDTGVPFVRVQDLQGGEVRADAIDLFISADTNSALSRSILNPKDVLVSIAGTIGRVAVVPESAPPMNCNQAVALVRTAETLCPDFLAAWLNTRDAARQIGGSRVTGTISNLSLTSIRNLRLPLPSIDHQKQFFERVERARSLMLQVDTSRNQINALFDSLQHRAFRGEL